jgi:hypothetical protein
MAWPKSSISGSGRGRRSAEAGAERNALVERERKPEARRSSAGERQDGLASGVARRLERQLTGDARHRRNAHASLRRALGAHRVANDAERVAEDVEADAHVADGRRRESRCRGARHRPAG